MVATDTISACRACKIAQKNHRDAVPWITRPPSLMSGTAASPLRACLTMEVDVQECSVDSITLVRLPQAHWCTR